MKKVLKLKKGKSNTSVKTTLGSKDLLVIKKTIRDYEKGKYIELKTNKEISEYLDKI